MATATAIPCDMPEASREAAASAVVAALKATGYTVTEGVQEAETGPLGKLFGANPGNPYVVYKFDGLLLERPDFALLDPRSAVLAVVCTPPPVRYFSWRSYLMTEPAPTFASLGQTLNNLLINTSGSVSGADVFRRTAAIVTTGDAATYAAVRDALAGAGLGNATNLDGYAPSTVPHQALSRFGMLHRSSVWANESERGEYYAERSPVYLLTPPRAQPATPLSAEDGRVAYRRRGTGEREADVPGLTGALAQLRSRVLASFAGRRLLSESVTAPRVLNGLTCIAERRQCLGDNQDTNYLHSNASTLEEDEAFVLVGANCVANGKCTYTNVGLYAVRGGGGGGGGGGEIARHLKSTNVTADDRAFAGSAAAFAPELSPDLARRLFAYVIARDCAPFGRHCLELPTSQAPDHWALVFRTYLEPATKTGPDPHELVLPALMRFGPPVASPVVPVAE